MSTTYHCPEFNHISHLALREIAKFCLYFGQPGAHLKAGSCKREKEEQILRGTQRSLIQSASLNSHLNFSLASKPPFFLLFYCFKGLSYLVSPCFSVLGSVL